MHVLIHLLIHLLVNDALDVELIPIYCSESCSVTDYTRYQRQSSHGSVLA